jgi:hypothetical protein
MVLGWEGYVYFALFTDLLADQLLLEGIDKGMGTDG